jgi:eukaryotic-like serine/threonine-protein kinase
VTLAAGLRLGPYEVVAQVGRGGMGEVYRALDTRLNRRVAIKVLRMREDAPSHEERFEVEARAIAALNHPNICTLYDIGTYDGMQFLVMEFLEGRTLAEVLRGRPLLTETAREYARQIADALAAAHANGIVHRDLKPGNVMITASGAIKILDFGLAKVAPAGSVEDAVTAAQTRAGTFVGTTAYAAPEQFLGEPVDARTDVFAFGRVLYEMLTGRRPFEGVNAFDSATATVRDEPAPMPETTPAALRSVVLRCLAKAPGDRFADGREISKALSDGVAVNRVPSPAAFPSIAVLPFADLSPARDQDYFCDGVADELITALMTLEHVRVASRMSSFQFRDAAVDVTEVGRRLKVATVLEGSVRRAGARVRITAQLTSVADGFQIWSERYDRDLDDIFAVQDEIAQTIVKKLKASFARPVSPGSTTAIRVDSSGYEPRMRRSPRQFEAYSQYLKGRHSAYKLTWDALARGVDSFKRAIEMEPDYADAHAGLAQAYILQGLFSQEEPRAIMPRAKASAERALALDDGVADAYLSLAMVQHWYDWDWEAAEASYRKAIELSPGDANARLLYTSFLSTRGRGEEAVAEARRAIDLDPLSLVAQRSLADTLYFLERYDETIAESERIIEFEPAFFSAYWMLGLAKAGKGQYAEALEVFDRGRAYSYGDAALEGYAGWARAMVGRSDEARAIAEQLKARRTSGYVSAACIGQIYQGLGEIDEAIAWYTKSHEERSGHCVGYRLMPLLAPIRDDPRFQVLLEQIEAGT